MLGLLYGAVLSIRLPKDLSMRELFPLVMLFLFIMVLAWAPTRLFTFSLIYTTRALIVFRGLIAVLNRIQAAKGPTEKNQITLTIGFTLEFMVSAIFVYSTFRPVSPDVLAVGSHILGSGLMIFVSLYTPFWIPGVALGALSFSPTLRIWSIVGFGLLAVYESNFSPRARSTLT
jgi:hypothetical protein